VIRILLLTILVLLVARAFWRLVDGILEAAGGTSRARAKTPGIKLVRDPVCGTYVTPGVALSLHSRGRTYHFCSERCRSQFQSST
jgi:YHS domain-containing protein